MKKIFSIFLIFNLTFVSSAQAAATFLDSFDVSGQDTNPRGLRFNNDGTKMFLVGNDGEDVNVDIDKKNKTVNVNVDKEKDGKKTNVKIGISKLDKK